MSKKKLNIPLSEFINLKEKKARGYDRLCRAI